MHDLHFANPGWFHAIWLVIALVVLLFWLDNRGRAILDRFLSRTMQQRLARRISPARRWISFLLIGCAAAMLVVALMRPQWGLTYRRMPRVGAQLMVCLDVSKSMLAEDTAPNRLERAKVEIADLLAFLDGDQVGLIAFAGKAAVLCPLTPDFGFFRLILDDVGPHNVGRGGTKLEEPIRKALAGFRTESDVQRVILLVTDGEDHDSFPLEAAKDAAERGIKIIAIGFGDETGSQIQVTDPRTGVRNTLRDNNGQEVTTSLDGEMLREIVQVTDGIYVPAGTGTLDLASIYEAHIAPLTRGKLDDRGQVVRREGFQWAILSGLIFLIAAIAVRSGSVAPAVPMTDLSASAPAAKSSLAAILFFILATQTSLLPGRATVAAAQSPPPKTESANPSNDQTENEETPTNTSSNTKSGIRETPDPRETFNHALACLDTDLDRADQLLTSARRESGTDGEVRFRSTYNMGWVEVKRADQLLEDEPEQALVHLQAAADWFRDAIRLRPDHRDARHNLEVVLRRAMELADSLREKDSGDLAQRLDTLIDTERQLVDHSSRVVMQVAAENDTNAADKFRGDFRRLAVEQRKTLSDSQALARSAGEELNGLQGKQDEELEPQQRMRAAQLSNVLHYLNRANQKLGQARSQMRRRQGERAFRRAAAGLDELKRARDQLRNPDEVLGMILGDAIQVAKFTGALATANRDVPIPARPPADLPAWLTSAYVQQSQDSVTERSDELVAWLQAGLEQDGAEQAPGSPQDQQQSPADQAMLEQIRDAMPFVQQGASALKKASDSLTIEQFLEANQQQAEGIRALQQARERLLNLKGLIELTYADQATITSVLAPAEQTEDAPEPSAELVQSRQKKNLERAERIRRMLDQEQQELESSPPAAGGGQPGQDQTQTDAAKQRFMVAHQLLNQAESEMQKVVQALETSEPDSTAEQPETSDAGDDQKETEPNKDSTPGSESTDSPQEDPRAEAHTASERAVDNLQALRRLFFSVVEHLRETAQRQAQLNDETEQAATLATDDQDLPTKLGPLAPRQNELESMSGQIAEALQQQAQQNPAAAAGQQDQGFDQQQQMAEVTQKLTEAASLVAEGQSEMKLAGEQLNDEAPQVETARSHQDSALQKLAEALALLVPPQQQNQQQQDQQQQQQSEQEQQQSEDESQRPQTGSDPTRLLQAVRDREARRRREKQKQRNMPQETVEKDW